MPDFWTHIIGGKGIVENLDEDYLSDIGRLSDIIADHPQLFNFGCQGPDFFFYNDVWPWLKVKRGPTAGRKLQLENISRTFTTSVDLLKGAKGKKDFELILTYFTGFLAHYYLDRYLHPFIIKKARGKGSAGHKQLELLIDCYFIKRKWGKKAYKLATVPAINLGNELPQVIIDYFKKILSSVHGYPEDVSFINDSYCDMKKALYLFHSPYHVKRMGIKFLNKFFNFDLNILLYSPQPDYTLLKSAEWERVEEMFNRAVSQGSQQLKLILNYLNGRVSSAKIKDAFPEIDFSGKRVQI